MNLPPKALNVLASIKERIIVATTPEPNEPSSKGDGTQQGAAVMENSAEVRVPSRFMRHAREHGGAFQRMCRRKDWASPVY